MPDDSDARRDELHQFLQEQGSAHIDKQAVLVGWVVVQDWMDEDGDRWLTKAHSASLPTWVAAGLHHEALNGNWPEHGSDEDE